jgi:hypothetical protein
MEVQCDTQLQQQLQHQLATAPAAVVHKPHQQLLANLSSHAGMLGSGNSTSAAAAAAAAAGHCCLCFSKLNKQPKVCQNGQVLAVEQLMHITAALKEPASQVQLARLILKPCPGNMRPTAATAAATAAAAAATATRLSFTAAAAASHGPRAAAAALAPSVATAATATSCLPWC